MARRGAVIVADGAAPPADRPIEHGNRPIRLLLLTSGFVHCSRRPAAARGPDRAPVPWKVIRWAPVFAYVFA